MNDYSAQLRERALSILFGENYSTHEGHDDDERCYVDPDKDTETRQSVNDIIAELEAKDSAQ